MREVARLLGCSDNTVRALAGRGELTVLHHGAERRFRRSEVVAFAASRARDASGGTRGDARALEMIAAGRSDAAIVAALEIPLAHVRALRDEVSGDADLRAAERELEATRERLRAERDARRERLRARRLARHQSITRKDR